MAFLRLLGLLFKHGRIRHSGHNFNEARSKDLEKISRELDVKNVTTVKKRVLPKNSILRNLLVQVGFIKASYRQQFNHIEIPDKQLAYIRIPKAASTSVGFSIVNALFPNHDFSNMSASELNHLIDSLTRVGNPDKSLTYFTLCRNPYTRILSVYKSFFEKKDGLFLYEDYLFGILKRDLSFQEFLIRIQAIPNKLKDQHFKPQSDLLAPYKKISVSILKLEEIGETSSFLQSKGLVLPHMNPSSTDRSVLDYYDELSAKIVQKVYENDFKMLDYSTEVPSS